MEKIIFDLPWVHDILTELNEIKKRLEEINNERISRESWLNSKEAAKALGITTRTLQSYRDQGFIPFSQFGREIRYKAEDIQQFLMDHYVKATIEGRRGE